VRVRVQQRVALYFIIINISSAAGPAHAFTVEHRDTRYVDKQYQCELTVTIDAPLDRVEAVLRDYEQYPELDPRILQAHVLERPEANVAMLQTTLRACFGPFCRNVNRIERVEESPGVLAATTDATRSDVKFGETRTALERIDSGSTRVTYRTTIMPGFWIPAFAGRRWMLRTLEDASSNLFMNVEAKARVEAE
ncbi:MAG: SRPBCC family protein, partial [Steroidobacter sp.]